MKTTIMSISMSTLRDSENQTQLSMKNRWITHMSQHMKAMRRQIKKKKYHLSVDLYQKVH